MFTDLIDYPIETDRVDHETRQVLRDLDGTPHLFTRVKLTGTEFPHRALEPYVRVGDVESRFVEIDDDGTAARAYFDRPLPQGGTIEFGYDVEPPLLRLRGDVDPRATVTLDPERLPDGTRFVDRFFDDDEPVIG